MHPCRLPRALELSGSLLGLPLPRLALCRGRDRSERARRQSPGTGRTCEDRRQEQSGEGLAPPEVMQLERQPKIALDERRLLILGTQGLFEFQFNGIALLGFWYALPLRRRIYR